MYALLEVVNRLISVEGGVVLWWFSDYECAVSSF